jgi:hypothetical protein
MARDGTFLVTAAPGKSKYMEWFVNPHVPYLTINYPIYSEGLNINIKLSLVQ